MNALKAAFVRLLNAVGLERRDSARDIATLQAMSPRPGAGLIMELIGTQGVGKTTLSNALYRHLKDNWFFRNDLRASGPHKVENGPLEKLHSEIYFARLQALKSQKSDPWKTLTIGKQMSNVIYESLLLATHDFPRGFVMDEGLFKNFPQEVLADELEDARLLWDMRIFVHVRARDPRLAMDRHQSRRQTRQNKGLFQHAETAETLLERIRADDDAYARIITQAQALGRPVTTVYIEDGLDSNLAQILEFEQSLKL